MAKTNTSKDQIDKDGNGTVTTSEIRAYIAGLAKLNERSLNCKASSLTVDSNEDAETRALRTEVTEEHVKHFNAMLGAFVAGGKYMRVATVTQADVKPLVDVVLRYGTQACARSL